MALGDRTELGPDAYAIEVLAAATATNGAPTGAAGVDANALRGFGAAERKLRVGLVSTAGSGTMTVTARLWLRLGSLGWVVGATLNAGSAIAETGTDTIGYSEIVDVVDGADRLYLELTAIAGTATAIKGELVVTRGGLP